MGRTSERHSAEGPHYDYIIIRQAAVEKRGANAPASAMARLNLDELLKVAPESRFMRANGSC